MMDTLSFLNAITILYPEREFLFIKHKFYFKQKVLTN